MLNMFEQTRNDTKVVNLGSARSENSSDLYDIEEDPNLQNLSQNKFAYNSN